MTLVVNDIVSPFRFPYCFFFSLYIICIDKKKELFVSLVQILKSRKVGGKARNKFKLKRKKIM